MEMGTSESPVASPFSGPSREHHVRSQSVTEGQTEQASLPSPVQKSIRRVRSQGRTVETVSSLDGTRPPRLRAERSEWGDNSTGSRSQCSVPSTSSAIEDVVGTSESILSMRGEGSEDGSILSSIQKSEEDIHSSSPTNELDEGRIDCDIFNQLQQAMDEVDTSKREARKELVKRLKAEKDASEAMRKARKAMDLELHKIKSQHDEVMEKFRTASDQKRAALESQFADCGLMIQELRLERDNAIKEAEELRTRREEEATTSHRRHFLYEFSFNEIIESTRNFDPSLKIGEGGYGSVYKGFLRNTEVAIKLLNSNSLQGHLEFQQEVDVLSRMRHPNLVTLIGTCPENCALVYEYLPNGSLEDRLACKDNTQPLSWQTRIRIAVEICSALIFLHDNKPHGIIHGDLKPANILLDANFVSKLGDFGICRLLAGSKSVNDSATLFCITNNPKGTPAYMDPMYLSTGELTPKSDVYSFGIVLLQILTGKPAFGIAKEVQSALDQGTLSALLDSSAGDWPFVQAEQMAYLALRCCEMNRKNRPSLISDVWRILEPMKAACRASSSSFYPESEEHSHIPSYFICPIFQEIMSDPQVAVDGFTYEAEAIKGWLEGGHDTSPMTNLKLAHCNLIPNRSLRSEIEEWKQQHI